MKTIWLVIRLGDQRLAVVGAYSTARRARTEARALRMRWPADRRILPQIARPAATNARTRFSAVQYGRI